MKFSRWILLISATLLAPAKLVGQTGPNIPDSISVQMFVTDTGTGLPIDTPSVTVTFKLYKGASEVWSETQPGLAINDGILNAILGGVTPLDSVAFNVDTRLGVTIGGDTEISPLVPLVPAPYALAVRGFHAVFGDVSAVTAGYNIIAGSEMNSVAPGLAGVTISGGGGLQNGADRPNTATASWSTIGGGVQNQTSAEFTTISGGLGNVASGGYATVSGGATNTASGQNATVSGGSANSAVGNSVVAGGVGNIAGPNSASTIGGGLQNTASGQRSVVAGGYSNTANALHSTVSGGIQNTAGASSATVVGGNKNVASGTYSTVLGGSENQAIGSYSAAAGFRASAEHTGSFVWRDRSAPMDTFSTTGPNQFIILAEGGVGINTNTPSPFPFQVGDSTAAGSGSGAHLTGGGTWTNGSSREFKTAFQPVDRSAILEEVADLDISTWEYKGSDEGRHMGPVAEDFARAFRLGKDNHYISTVDADGVALAAIQRLYQLVTAQQERIEELEQQVTAMDSGSQTPSR